MTDYIIVKEYLLQNFTSDVNEKIKQGYIPVGGVTTKNDAGFGNYYMQAMIKNS
jgi:hypothetical protein